MRLLIFGPQASGKGTQAARVAEHFRILHISTGDIFRENISQETELGKLAASYMNDGNLVPNEVTNNLVKNRLEEEDCAKGFILDGYPRTRNQAEFLTELNHKFDAAINLQVSESEIIKRIGARRICENCKTGFNTIFIKPKVEGVCDKCNGKLIIREDDKPEAIKKRLSLYHELTEPLLDFYREKGLIVDINGDPIMDEVYAEIIQKLSA
ncbi:adenylate kinase [archaeon]|nr:adenylate kinase [archaeon]MBL7057390.1 adenylate kinase [Candidatus Woesearchaeota archaeon]